MDVFMCGGTTWMSMWGWGSKSVPLALSLPIASAMPWPTSIAATAVQGSWGNLQDRPHGQQMLSCPHDITSSPFQLQSHPNPTNVAGFVQRELRLIPTSWKHSDEFTRTLSFSFLWTSVATHCGRCLLRASMCFKYKSKSVCFWMTLWVLKERDRKRNLEGKNSKWKL